MPDIGRLNTVPIVDIQDACDWYYTLLVNERKSKDEIVQLDEPGAYAPPFDEWKMRLRFRGIRQDPKTGEFFYDPNNRETQGIKYDFDLSAVDLTLGDTPKQQRNAKEFIVTHINKETSKKVFLSDDDYDGWRWSVYGTLRVEDLPFATIGYNVMADGSIGNLPGYMVPLEFYDNYYNFLMTNYPDYLGDDAKSEDKFNRIFVHEPVRVVLFATSIMHCRNVDTVKKPVTRQQIRRAQREQRDWVYRYEVLKIDGLRHEVGDGDGKGGGYKAAMHICRAHFKTFTEENPLFGKWTGRYFWHKQTRGNSSRGIVSKDYEVVK